MTTPSRLKCFIGPYIRKISLAFQALKRKPFVPYSRKRTKRKSEKKEKKIATYGAKVLILNSP